MSKDAKKGVARVSEDTWLEWRTKCTFAKCSEQAANQLFSFGKSRLAKGFNCLKGNAFEYLSLEYCSDDVPKQRAWSLLEGVLCVPTTKHNRDSAEAKTAKELMFARVQTPSEMEAYITTIFKNTVARKIAYSETYGGLRGQNGSLYQRVTRIDHLDKPITSDSDAAQSKITLLDTLCDRSLEGACNVELAGDEINIVDDTALKVVQKLWDSWSERLRLACIFFLHEVKVSEVNGKGVITDCKQSQLYKAFECVKKDIRNVDWGFKIEPDERDLLWKVLLRHLIKVAEDFIEKSEKRVAIRSILREQ